MSQSLHSFCKERNLSKTSVRRWLQDNGFDTSDGLTESARKAASAHFEKKIRRSLELPENQIDLPEKLSKISSDIVLVKVNKLCQTLQADNEILTLQVEELKLLVSRYSEVFEELEHRVDRLESTLKDSGQHEGSSAYSPSPWIKSA